MQMELMSQRVLDEMAIKYSYIAVFVAVDFGLANDSEHVSIAVLWFYFKFSTAA